MKQKISDTLKQLWKEKRWLTFSNMLTLLRIVLVPFIVIGIVGQLWLSTFFMLLAAAFTDFFDGYLARRFGDQTELGACLDPIADKILLVSCFSALAFIDSPSFSIPIWFVFLIFFREMFILGGSIVLFLLGIRFKVSPSIGGKLTTFFQLSFILWLFVCYFFDWNPVKTYSVLIVMLAILSIISLVHYCFIGVSYVGGKRRV